MPRRHQGLGGVITMAFTDTHETVKLEWIPRYVKSMNNERNES